MGVDISFDGIGNLVEELERMNANASSVENEALQMAAAPILAEAQHTTAFSDLTGKLRKSLKISKVKRNTYNVLSIQVLTNDPVAHLVEFGHGGSALAPAHPFLQPAFNHHRAEAQEIIRQKLAEALKRITN